MDDGQVILATGALLTAGLGATLVAARVRVPSLILFLGLGMLIGSEGLGLVSFSDYELARFLGITALAFILFEGGLAAGWSTVAPVLKPALSLALPGTVITAVIMGLAAHWVLGVPVLEGLLLGAVVSSTDGAAIFAVLRGSTLRRRLAHTLEAEAGFNDPVAVFLVVGFIHWIERPAYGIADMVLLFVQEMGIGLVVGLIVGRLAVAGLQRLELASSGLYPVASLAIAALAYGGAASLHGSGFLAVYLVGLQLGDARIPAKRTIVAFHEGLAWLSQVAMFFMLGLLVFPSQLGDVALEGTVLAIILAFIARPVAAMIATAPLGFSLREQTAVGWAGLRGAVPVVLAIFPIVDHVTDALKFFNVVFFAVVVSTLLQGSTFQWLAGVLGVTSDQPALPRPLTESGTIRGLGAEVVEYPVAPQDAIVGARIHDLRLPREALVSVIVRGGEAVLPRGSTMIEAGDELHVLVRAEATRDLPDLLERWRQGPIQQRRRRGPFVRAGGTIFTTRPWAPDDGNAGRPADVNGVEVVEMLRTRQDRDGSLVALADGRYAVCGSVLAVGSRPQLASWTRRRLERAEDETEREWWRELAGALAG